MPNSPLFVGFDPPPHVRQILEGRRSIRYGDLSSTDPGHIADQIGEANAAIVVGRIRFSADVIAALPPHLKILATYSVGYDHIDVVAAQARGLIVLNTPDVLSNAVAECALLLMLGVARRATESINLVRSRHWTGWTPDQLLGFELAGKRLGVFGMGRIGLAIARKAAALGMEIVYHNRRSNPQAEAAGFRLEADFNRFLGDLDMLMLAAPSTPQTRGVIDAPALAKMRPGTTIINIARGDLIIDMDLIAALQDGHIAGAGLDVFDREPAIHPGYFALPNVVMFPHGGSSTHEARAAMINLLLDGIEKVEKGEKVENHVVA